MQETTSEIKRLTAAAAGVIRSGEAIEAALNRLEEVKSQMAEWRVAGDFNELVQCLEVEDMALSAEIILGAALRRRESRGAHYRKDFPDTDDETWRKNIIVKRSEDGSMGFEIREISEQ